MPINPLDTPWVNKQKEGTRTEEPKPQKPVGPSKASPEVYLGIRGDRTNAAFDEEDAITVRVMSSRGAAAGDYRISYREGTNLGSYLRDLGMRSILSKSAVYDLTNPENGRCRATYIPGPGAILRVGPPSYGIVSHLQRSDKDAQRVARDMGSRGSRNSPREVEVNLGYGRPRSEKKKKRIDVDQV